MEHEREREGAEEGVDHYTFELAFSRLEEIVRLLEGGEPPLHESLVLFEEGVRMARLCSRRLDEAETKIRLLLEEADGSVEAVPWDEADKMKEGWDGID